MLKIFPNAHSLSATLLKKVLAVYFAITLIFTTIHIFVEYNYQKNSLKTELEKIEHVFKPALSRAFWDMNREQIRMELDGLINMQSIKEVQAFDKDGAIIYDRVETPCMDCEKSDIRHSFDVERELFGQKIKLGTISIFLDRGVILERIKINFLMLFFNAMLKSIILVSLFFIAFNRYLSNPMNRLMDAIGEIDIDNFKSEKIEYFSDRPDEIYKLTNKINQMLEKLESEIQNSRQKDAMLYQHSKMAAMGEMIGNISHQWKQPLNAIAIYIDSIKGDFDDGLLDGQKMEKYRNDVWQQIKYMDITMREFKDFYKPNRKKTLFNPNKAILSSLEILKPLIKEKNITISVELENTLEFYGYQNELSQVLINIVKNASDEMQNNVKKRVLVVSTKNLDNKIIISIQDSAGGVPQGIASNIFERNFSTKLDSGGSGLGLNMSQSIIREHFGGEISFANKSFIFDGSELYGACFEISIPTQS